MNKGNCERISAPSPPTESHPHQPPSSYRKARKAKMISSCNCHLVFCAHQPHSLPNPPHLSSMLQAASECGQQWAKRVFDSGLASKANRPGRASRIDYDDGFNMERYEEALFGLASWPYHFQGTLGKRKVARKK